MPAVGRCDGCGRVVCAGCETYVGVTRRCDGCARRSARRSLQLARRVSAMLLVAGMAASLGVGLVLGIAESLDDPPAMPASLVK
jgi:hypothetical protein